MIKLPFRKLEVWKLGMEIAKEVYILTKNFPKEEIFGLVSQMRRSSQSVPSNIAEGSQRSTDKDFAHFVSTALGSLAELETQIELALEFNYLQQDRAEGLLQKTDQCAKMLVSLRKRLLVNKI